MATFAWTPDYGASKSVKPRALLAPFGDGYEQRAGDGINTQAETWLLVFSARSDAEADAIDAFLAARDGVESFDWTTLDGLAAKFICREWQKTHDRFNSNTIRATFIQVFGE